MNQALFDYIAASPTAFHAVAHTAAMLDQAGFEYEKLDAEAPENRALVDAYQINRAPTLIVETGAGIEKLTNASEIRAYLKK